MADVIGPESGGVKALLFDWDGTLADTEEANFQALRHSLQLVGADLGRDWYRGRIGLSTRDLLATFASSFNVELDLNEAVRHRQAHYMASLCNLREVTAVADIVRRHFGVLPIALATGGEYETVSASMTQLGMSSWFDVVVTREDVAFGKPAPDIFLLAAERLDVSPADCLVYEDTDEGLVAAAAAGMRSVDIRSMKTGSATSPAA